MTISFRRPLWVACAVVLGVLATERTALAQETCEEGIIQGTQDQPLVVDSIRDRRAILYGLECHRHWRRDSEQQRSLLAQQRHRRG